jgi:hypothetical protein
MSANACQFSVSSKLTRLSRLPSPGQSDSERRIARISASSLLKCLRCVEVSPFGGRVGALSRLSPERSSFGSGVNSRGLGRVLVDLVELVIDIERVGLALAVLLLGAHQLEPFVTDRRGGIGQDADVGFVLLKSTAARRNHRTSPPSVSHSSSKVKICVQIFSEPSERTHGGTIPDAERTVPVWVKLVSRMLGCSGFVRYGSRAWHPGPRTGHLLAHVETRNLPEQSEDIHRRIDHVRYLTADVVRVNERPRRDQRNPHPVWYTVPLARVKSKGSRTVCSQLPLSPTTTTMVSVCSGR